MIEQVPLTTVPSASTFLALLEKQWPDVKSFVGFCSPVLPESFPPLLYSEKEVEKISKILQQLTVKIYKGKEANEEMFDFLDCNSYLHDNENQVIWAT